MIEGFKKLSDSVSVYRPQTPRDRHAPLIVLCTWAEASLKHISKYIQVYRQLHPGATIVLVQTTFSNSGLRWSAQSQHSRLQPAREVILEHLDNDLSAERMLVQAFSNGGALTAGLLLEGLYQDSTAVFGGSLILDSCPGKAAYLETCHAFIVSGSLHKLPAVLSYAASAVVYAMLFPLLAVPNALGIENAIARSGRLMNTTSLVSPKTPRLYLYSKTDDMVRWEDVRDHAAEARQRGFEDVRDICWERGGHCAHIMDNGVEYWDAVNPVFPKKKTTNTS